LARIFEEAKDLLARLTTWLDARRLEGFERRWIQALQRPASSSEQALSYMTTNSEPTSTRQRGVVVKILCACDCTSPDTLSCGESGS
jgi:hypothetical protein